MKKQLLIPVLALVALASCSHQDEPQPSGEKVKVTFNVAALNVDVQPMTRATASAKDSLEHIICRFYNKSSKDN